MQETDIREEINKRNKIEKKQQKNQQNKSDILKK